MVRGNGGRETEGREGYLSQCQFNAGEGCSGFPRSTPSDLKLFLTSLLTHPTL